MTRGSSQGEEVGRRLYFRERDEYSAGHNSQCTCSAGGARARTAAKSEREDTHTQGREREVFMISPGELEQPEV